MSSKNQQSPTLAPFGRKRAKQQIFRAFKILISKGVFSDYKFVNTLNLDVERLHK